MPEIRPFRGYLYNQAKVDLQNVVAPPYDVISPTQQEELYARSPYNIVRLILGKEENRYSSAAKHFLEWQDAGILVRGRKPAIYVLHQTFENSDGKSVTRKGFIALCRLEEFHKKIVLPHEKTLAKPREDRLKLLKACNANFSQIFSLYSDPEKRIDSLLKVRTGSKPSVEVMFENVRNTMWIVEDGTIIEAVQNSLGDKQVLIADGHHRYETALAYRDFMKSRDPQYSGNEPYDYVMMFFTNLDDEGLVIYPTHRIVHSLENFAGKAFLDRISEFFVCRDFKEPHALLAALASSSTRSFGMLVKDDPHFYLITLKPTLSSGQVIKDTLPEEVKELDVTLLHSLILKDLLGISSEAQEQKLHIDYVKSEEEALSAVWRGKAQLAFLMNATKIGEVRRVARAGHTMPQKSTYFYPKLLSGLVINKLSE
jgi:uncharacterized protein (DUF1015 family)